MFGPAGPGGLAPAAPGVNPSFLQLLHQQAQATPYAGFHPGGLPPIYPTGQPPVEGLDHIIGHGFGPGGGVLLGHRNPNAGGPQRAGSPGPAIHPAVALLIRGLLNSFVHGNHGPGGRQNLAAHDAQNGPVFFNPTRPAQAQTYGRPDNVF